MVIEFGAGGGESLRSHRSSVKRGGVERNSVTSVQLPVATDSLFARPVAD